MISASIAIAAALVFYVIEDPDAAVTAGLLLLSVAAASAQVLIVQGAGIAAAGIILAIDVESLSARLSLLALGLVLAIVAMGMNLVGNRRAESLGWISLATASILVLTGLSFLVAERTPSAASGALLLIVLAGAIVTRIPSLWPLSAGVFLLTASAFIILMGWPDQANAIGAAAFYCLLSGSLLALVRREGN